MTSRINSRINVAREEMILNLWRQGRREQAMRLIMDTYGAGLLAFARRMVRDEDIAQDVRQQTLVEAWRGLDQFENRSSLWTWMCAILRNRCLDQIHRRARIDAREVAVDIDVLKVVLGAPDGPMPSHQLAQRAGLEHCLHKLSDAVRAQVLMRCHLGLCFAEIAAIVGEPAGTIQVRVARALPKLRRCLESYGRAR